MIMADPLKLVVSLYMFLKDSLYLVHMEDHIHLYTIFKVVFHPKYKVNNILPLLVKLVLIFVSTYLQFKQVHS